MKESFINRLLTFVTALLLFVMAVNAFGGGYYGLSGAKNVPAEWLQGTIFKTYFYPSLILFVVVGGSSLTGFVLIAAKRKRRFFWSGIASCIVLTWILVQVMLIGFVSWLQPAVALIGIVTAACSYHLHKEERLHHSGTRKNA